MKHPEYDSPFELAISGITTQMAKNIDEMCWQALQRVNINVDKEKLLIALKQDSERYRKAYANGYDTGYEKRDDELVRCKDCKYGEELVPPCGDRYCVFYDQRHNKNWFCANGKPKEQETYEGVDGKMYPKDW